jgi:hypothetical protein
LTTSPDDTYLLALSGTDSIEARRLPLQLNGEDIRWDDERSGPHLIRTELPEDIQAALEIDPPIELLCVESCGTAGRASDDEQETVLPRVLLYTRKSAYLLQIAFDCGAAVASPARGRILSVEQPFQSALDLSQTSVVRIRSAAGRGAVHAPPGSLVALLHQPETCMYTVELRHSTGETTTPVELFLEEETADAASAIVDFCFAPATGTGLDLFASLSILLLQRTGRVLLASPIVFEGTVVDRSLVEQGHNFLDGLIETCVSSSAVWRQARAARQLLIDVFGSAQGRNRFCTARVCDAPEKSAVNWPVQLQGPVFANQDENEQEPLAVTIESFGNTDAVIGLAMGKEGGRIDVGVLSPASFLPRFLFEKAEDAFELNESLQQRGALTERVQVGDGTNGRSLTGGNESMVLLRDPALESLLHCATPSAVFTVSTNVVRVTSQTLKGSSSTETVRTTAWSCLRSSSPVQGVVVVSRPDQGHELVARLADRSLEIVNVTERQLTHEMEFLSKGYTEQQRELQLQQQVAGSPAFKALRTTESTRPFYEKIEPLIEQINKGLAGMSKIVGSETEYKDVTPDILAVANRVKERCDKEVVLPMLELKKAVDAQKEGLRSMIETQQRQVESLTKQVATLRERMNAIGERMQQAEENAMALSDRSSRALQASRDLLNTATQAEYDYFQDMRRLDLKVKQMATEMKDLAANVTSRCESLEEKKVSDTMSGLSAEEVKRANALLKGQEAFLQESRKRLDAAEVRTAALFREQRLR